MKAIGFSGREYTWNLNRYDIYADDTRKKSKHHLRARRILKEIYGGSYRILEEVKLPGSTLPYRKSVLYLDFFIPVIKVGIEVHGKQHYEFTPFFHKHMTDYLLAMNRDDDKANWCELNNIKLIVLKYSDSDNEWRNSINGV